MRFFTAVLPLLFALAFAPVLRAADTLDIYVLDMEGGAMPPPVAMLVLLTA